MPGLGKGEADALINEAALLRMVCFESAHFILKILKGFHFALFKLSQPLAINATLFFGPRILNVLFNESLAPASEPQLRFQFLRFFL